MASVASDSFAVDAGALLTYAVAGGRRLEFLHSLGAV